MGSPDAEQAVPVPPQSGNDAAGGISQHIPGIARRPGHYVRADDFKEDGPDNKIQRDLSQRRHFVGCPQAEQPMHQQQRGQRARDEQHVVEIVVHEQAVHMRLDAPAIEKIQETRKEEQSIAQVAELFHGTISINTSP